MKSFALWRLLVVSWRLLLVYEGPAIFFVIIAFYGFATKRIWLGVTTIILALLSTALCWYFVREVNEKEKELTEKNQREQPKTTGSAETKRKG